MLFAHKVVRSTIIQSRRYQAICAPHHALKGRALYHGERIVTSAGAQTCFKAVAGVTLGDAMARDKSKLPEEFAEAAFCDDYDFRCDATARTWLRPHAQDNLL